MSLSAIGFTTLLATRWVLKFLWAPLIDRFGTRQRWLLALNAVTLVLLGVAASRDIGAWITTSLVPFMVRSTSPPTASR